MSQERKHEDRDTHDREADLADMGAMEAGLASPPPELAAAMRRHGVIPPVTAHVEK